MKRRAGVSLAMVIATAGSAYAQSQQFVREIAGSYQIVPTDGSAVCGIQLTAEPLGKAWRARPDPNCAGRIRISAVVAWQPSDGIMLLDARARPAMTFVEDETGLPSSPDLQSPTHYLVPRITGYTHLPHPSELIGQWTLRSRGRPPCLLTLTAGPAYSSAPRRGITLGRGCAGQPLPARLTRLAIEDMKIMFWSAGNDMLALEPVADNRYVAEPGAWVLAR